MEERYNLAIDRMKAIIEEKTVAEPYREYFQHVARFILKLDELKQNVESGKQKEMSEEELQEEMKDRYPQTNWKQTMRNLMQIRLMRFWCWEENWEAFCLRFTPRSAEAFLMFRNSVWSML